MDFSENSIVQSCIKVSPNIKEYFEEEKYLAEVEQPELLTPSFVSIMTVNLLLDELAEIGLETNQTAEEIIEYPTEFNTVLSMREVFDSESFYMFLKSMTDTQFSDFRGIIEECNHPNDFLFEITEYCAAHFTIDERWQNIFASAQHWWWSTDKFANHVTTIINNVLNNSDPNKSYIDDNNINEVGAFLQNFEKRKIKIMNFASFLFHDDKFNFDHEKLALMIEKYDTSKLRPENLPKFANYFAHPEQYKTEDGKSYEPDFVIEHHRTVSHHMEYWKHVCAPKGVHNGRMMWPTEEHLALIVVSMALDGDSKEQMISNLSFLGNMLKDKSPHLLSVLKYLVDLDYSTILSGE